MAPKNKKKMKTQQEEEKCDVDRLSSLPYNLLHHILSFLDTKSAVRTSVLSKRYRYAWASLPCLDFKLTIANVHYFKASVSHVLQSREPCSLRSFRLSLHLPVASQFIKKCIDYAAQHRVQHLRIRGFTDTGCYSYTGLQSTFKLPTLLLTSTSLVTLRLNNAVSETSELPTSVSLPNLKGLSLKNFVFSETNYKGELFSGCPNLENLVLIKCSIKTKDELKILDVNCSNLKSLEIRNWRSPWECFDEHMIHVNAPGLVFFKFEGFLARVDFKNIMPCLKEAYIDLSYPTKCPSDRMIRTSESLLSLLQQISNVKFLSLLSKTFQVMSVKPESRKTTVSLFENLEIVEVRAQSLIKKLKRLFWPPEL